MPIVSVHRAAPTTQPLLYIGTQTIQSGGSFNLTGYTEFQLDPSVYTQAVTYVLVDYSLGSFTYPMPTYSSGQDALTALAIATVIGGGLTPSALTDDTVLKLIKVTLS